SDQHFPTKTLSYRQLKFHNNFPHLWLVATYHRYRDYISMMLKPQPVQHQVAPKQDNCSDGKTLTFVPPCLKNGIVTITIEEEHIQA
ncbi:hypothetical protein H5410_060654, partial [Solanum commersonii]